jgi:hypothetical protein
MFIETLISARKWGRSKLLISRWMHKLNKIFPYSGILFSYKNRNEALIHAAKLLNLKTIKLSERSQTQKSHIIWLHPYEMLRIGKSTETDSRDRYQIVIASCWREKGMREIVVSFFLRCWKCAGINIVITVAQVCEHSWPLSNMEVRVHSRKISTQLFDSPNLTTNSLLLPGRLIDNINT